MKYLISFILILIITKNLYTQNTFSIEFGSTKSWFYRTDNFISYGNFYDFYAKDIGSVDFYETNYKIQLNIGYERLLYKKLLLSTGFNYRKYGTVIDAGYAVYVNPPDQNTYKVDLKLNQFQIPIKLCYQFGKKIQFIPCLGVSIIRNFYPVMEIESSSNSAKRRYYANFYKSFYFSAIGGFSVSYPINNKQTNRINLNTNYERGIGQIDKDKYLNYFPRNIYNGIGLSFSF